MDRAADGFARSTRLVPSNNGITIRGSNLSTATDTLNSGAAPLTQMEA